MRGFGIFALTCALVGGTSSAHAGLNFDFSFTNTKGYDSGTVTGEIFGLTDNSTSAATDVVIDSYPTALLLPGTPWDIFNTTGFTLVDNENSFTVADGVVTAADFYIQDGSVVFLLNGYAAESALSDASGKNDVVNGRGFPGITFTAASSSTNAPEPASIALLLSGLFGLRLIRRRPSSR